MTEMAEQAPSNQTPPSRFRAIAAKVLEIEAAAIRGLLGQLDENFDRALVMMRDCRGRIICTGMGKSGHVMKKVAATLASTGTPALFLHPAEAIHGDLGMIVEGDVVLAASFSGNTEELLQMGPALRRKSVPMIAITASADSALARSAAVHLRAAIDQEACPLNLAPTASTTATLALGDALAMALSEAKGFTSEDFAHLHPAGQLGRRLKQVEQVMHRDEAVPAVDLDTPLRETIYEMSKKGLGITAVLDADRRLVGVVSDGDLRRFLGADEIDRPGVLNRSAASLMKQGPRTIDKSAPVLEALRMMEDHRITSLFVCDPDQRLLGVVHIHDLWGLGLR